MIFLVFLFLNRSGAQNNRKWDPLPGKYSIQRRWTRWNCLCGVKKKNNCKIYLLLLSVALTVGYNPVAIIINEAAFSSIQNVQNHVRNSTSKDV